MAIALSSDESNYMAKSSACFEAIWIHKFLAEFTDQML